MTSKDIMDLIIEYDQQLTVCGTLLSALAAALATYAAFSSANSARHSLRISEQAERRLSIRTTLMDAHAIEIECDRLGRLATELMLNYQSLAVFSGASGGSRDEMYQNAAREKQVYAKLLSTQAKELTANPSSLDTLDDKEIDQVKIKISATLLELLALRENIVDELSEIRLRNSEARNARLVQQSNHIR